MHSWLRFIFWIDYIILLVTIWRDVPLYCIYIRRYTVYITLGVKEKSISLSVNYQPPTLTQPGGFSKGTLQLRKLQCTVCTETCGSWAALCTTLKQPVVLMLLLIDAYDINVLGIVGCMSMHLSHFCSLQAIVYAVKKKRKLDARKMHSISRSGWPTVHRHYWAVLIYCSHWNTDEKNFSDMIDINLQVVFLETAESISFLSILWCSFPPVAPYHNSYPCTTEA